MYPDSKFLIRKSTVLLHYLPSYSLHELRALILFHKNYLKKSALLLPWLHSHPVSRKCELTKKVWCWRVVFIMRKYFSLVLDLCDIAIIVLTEDLTLKVVNIYPVVAKRCRTYSKIYIISSG